MQYFTYTIKPTKNEPSAEDYIFRCKSLLLNWHHLGVTLLDHVIEHDSLGKPHMHGTMYVPKNYYLKKLHQKNYAVRIDPITDLMGWINYINKKNQHYAYIDQKNAEYDFKEYGYAFT